MPGRGRAPKPQAARRNHHAPLRGEYRPAPGIGWQHGPIPEPPDGLLEPSRLAWDTWMRSWVAAHWDPGDLPALGILAKLYDATERGHLVRAGELRMWMDGYGLTPRGRQDRRWLPPEAADDQAPAVTPSGRYSHLVSLPEVRTSPIDRRPRRAPGAHPSDS
jgi:hypothetical protein